MSEWKVAKKEDMEIDGEDVNVYFESDEDGNRYICLKIADLKELLKDA